MKLEKKSRGYVKGKWRLGAAADPDVARHPPHRVRRGLQAAARGADPRDGGPHPRRRGAHRAARAEAQARRERRLPQAGPPDDPGPEAGPRPDPGGLRRAAGGDPAHPRHRDHGRGAGREGEEGAGRGQPPPRGLDRQEVHEPRPAVPGPHPGGQHRPHEGRGQVRVQARLQVLDLRHVVDPPGHHPRDRRPGAHHPHPRAHDRDDQQAHPHVARARPGARAASPPRRRSRSGWTSRSPRSARS